MQALSASTQAADAYRAGLELGSNLKAVAPEIVFLFSTIHYGDTAEVIEGLLDGLENPDLKVIGCSGDGAFESGYARDVGATALALNSGGDVNWLISSAQGVEQDPVATAEAVFSESRRQLNGRLPSLRVFFSDFRTDASLIEKVIEQQSDCPVVGGLAADDSQMKQCVVYANQQVLQDSVVLLSVDGPIRFEIHVGNSIKPVGKSGVIDAAEGSQINVIDGLSAMDFIERETGKPVLQSDRGITSLTIIDQDQSDIKRLRSIVPDLSDNARNLGLYGGIETGKRVQVCQATPEDLIAEVKEIAKSIDGQNFKPVAALIVSCAGRKWLLGSDIEHEVHALADNLDEIFPLAGFPSFGEIAPLKINDSYSRNLFHNMTYVLTLIGR
ncbi:hypothetical protein R50073_07260 [Maricurvus nonylphenolicus]|uniref:FIST signal transduction protein n=1 Tax=Maricurvus nonylphenolicus TaxID=1008307 RepID=UPI0036F261BD